MSAWPFGDLPPLSFDVIAADPPWDFELRSAKGAKKSAVAHYATMSTADICALPVGQLAQRDCVLLLWATAPRLPEALDVMNSWGFAYKTMLIWRKTTPAGKVRVGTGYWARTMHEPVLIGALGSPAKASAFPSLFDGVAREHSRKPDEFFDLVERCTTGARRLDLFSRQRRPGWTAWGDETEKFSAAPAAKGA
ncbi:MAG TPA: MT-A70 family methyltransferase [Methylocystis sp.]|nr:MT-A70 family methyltransferase [Methylocystis sp.]